MQSLEQFYDVVGALKLPTPDEIAADINVRLRKAIAEGTFGTEASRKANLEKETATATPRVNKEARKLAYCAWVFCNRFEHKGPLKLCSFAF